MGPAALQERQEQRNGEYMYQTSWEHVLIMIDEQFKNACNGESGGARCALWHLQGREEEE